MVCPLSYCSLCQFKITRKHPNNCNFQRFQLLNSGSIAYGYIHLGPNKLIRIRWLHPAILSEPDFTHSWAFEILFFLQTKRLIFGLVKKTTEQQPKKEQGSQLKTTLVLNKKMLRTLHVGLS